ncbi:N-terminal region of Chorein a TM vesicle-mediated sorter family protein [Babesia bovis T2Bo]|uniref:Uncharacterized protein n=1 Tax=Babesia bovis TaxID=5865 RepID=A7AQ57_BABBO|nr:N-terminal region of Chorein a TM vesicle-mediated sorter family protein [Babesia bovis T2Bo]EDO08691.1 N-terminal region of Chorein a TM vesicle-mediated sorter family protein [Babesia bovis T2Bo]|eukprot:XP_001612259.1 hypothetical protein [Babesia bovis T2Bo]
MIYKLIDHLVKSFGREVIEQWIPLERLNITSVTDPEITLVNIPIPEKLFDNPSMPFQVVKSNIGKVVIRCPWKTVLMNDGSVSLTVEVHDVDAVLRFKRLDEFDPEKVESFLIKTREKLLRKWNAAVSSLGLLSSKGGNKGHRGTAILNSLNMEVHNLKIMIADDMLYDEPFSITIESNLLIGKGISPDDPSLLDYEKQGVSDHMLNALWFTSSGVQIWLAIYHQGETSNTEDSMPENPFDHSDWILSAKRSRTKGDTDLSDTASSHDSDDDIIDEFPSRASSRFSDELFDEEPSEHMSQDTSAVSEGSFWNFCSVPCNADVEESVVEPGNMHIKPCDEGLMRVLQGPYKHYNVTPPEGLTLDIVFKMWAMSSLVSMPNASKEHRRTVEVSLRSTASVDTKGPPNFNGNIQFNPLDLMLTQSGAKILYNIIRYIQIKSLFKTRASADYNGLPDGPDCQRYIDIIRMLQWTHSEGESTFVKEMELKTAFHKLLLMKQMANATKNRIVRDNVCFISVPCIPEEHTEEAEHVLFQESIVQSYTWYQWDMTMRFIFPNFSLHVVMLPNIPSTRTLPAVVIQLSTFLLEYNTLCRRGSCDILLFKPIVRFGKVRVATRKRSFSAKVMMRPMKGSEHLLFYPERMITDVYDFFGNYGSDCINHGGPWEHVVSKNDHIVHISLQKYANDIKKVELHAPKLVLILNAFCSMDTAMVNMLLDTDFVNVQQFIESNELHGFMNPKAVQLMTSEDVSYSTKTVVKMFISGIVVRTLFQSLHENQRLEADWDSVDGTSTDQRNVCAKFILNDKMLSTWEYCEDIDDPFAFKHSYSNPGSRLFGHTDGSHKTVYGKSEFVSEMDTMGSMDQGAFVLLGPEGYNKLSLKSNLVNHLGKLRKWYRNTASLQLPQELLGDLGSLHSMVVKVDLITMNYLSESSTAYFTIGTALAGCTNLRGNSTELLNLKCITFAKKRNAICADLENVCAMLDPRIPLYKTIMDIVPSLKQYITRIAEFFKRFKSISKLDNNHLYRDCNVVCSTELCKALTTDYYMGSPDVIEGCSEDLMDALERKVCSVDPKDKTLFLSLGAVRVNIAAEHILYEFLVHKVQVDLCGRQRLKLYVGSMALCKVDASAKQVLLTSRQGDLGANVEATMTEVDNGQLMLDYNSKDGKYCKLEVRNVHHMVDMGFITTVNNLMKQLRKSQGSPPSRFGNVNGHIMIHHSSVHYNGIGAMVDVYATVKATDATGARNLSVDVPRLHVTFTSGVQKRVFAVSLLDLILDLSEYRQNIALRHSLCSLADSPNQDVSLINMVLELSHCAVWGFHTGTDDFNHVPGYSTLDEAARQLELVLHEGWFNHMTSAALPSYYDDSPVIVVPLLTTSYADNARLPPLLNNTWIKDWLEKASLEHDVRKTEVLISKILGLFPSNAMQQRKRCVAKVAASILKLKEVMVAIASVDLVAHTAVLHRESIRNILDLFASCRLLKQRKNQENTRDKKKSIVTKIDVNIEEIEVFCPYETGLRVDNTLASTLLPNVLVNTPMHKRRPKTKSSAFYIFRIHSVPCAMARCTADSTVMMQSSLTLHLVRSLYNNMKYLQAMLTYAFFDYVDMMEDARYQASRHLFDVNDDERKGTIISFTCHKLKLDVLCPEHRLEYWRDLVQHTKMNTCPEAPELNLNFKVALRVDVSNLNSDIALANHKIEMIKAAIQHVEITDAFDKQLVQDLYGARCALGDIGYIDETSFCYPADQVSVTLTSTNDVQTLKVTLEHTRTELQIDGVSVILGLVQDLKFPKPKEKSNKQKRTLIVEFNLNLHEIWLYHSLPKESSDQSDGPDVVSMRSNLPTVAEIDQRAPIPRVIKRAKEVDYNLNGAMTRRLSGSDAEFLHNGKVLGCLISVSITYNRSGCSSFKIKYMGVTHAKLRLINGLKVLADERNDCLLDTLNNDERNLFEFRESCISMKRLDNGHLIVAFQASKPRVSINVDQLFHLCLLKPYLITTAIETLKAHKMHWKGTVETSREEEPDDSMAVETHDFMDAVSYVAAKYDIPMVDLSKMNGVYKMSSDVEEANIEALQVREKGNAKVAKMLHYINKLLWHDDDPQLTVSVALSDCKCSMFSHKNELALTFNMHQISFDLTHTAPTSKKRTVVDSSMIFNISTFNTRLDNHDTVLQTTVATFKVTYEDVGFEMPALDLNMHLSGLALEVNPYLMQLMKQLKTVSKVLSSGDLGVHIAPLTSLKLYNELEVNVAIYGGRSGQRKTVDLMHLPSQRYTNVFDKEIYIFISKKSSKGSLSQPRDTFMQHFTSLHANAHDWTKWLAKEQDCLLLGNSINVRSALTVLRGKNSAKERGIDIQAITQAHPNLSLAFIGKYHLEQTGSRLFRVPNSMGMVLMEQYTDDSMEPYIILSSSIRIQNSTDIPISIYIDNKMGYFAKVALKLTQHAQTTEELEEMYLEPYSSASVPLSWFSTAMMPMVAPIFSKEEDSENGVPFQYLYNLLNRNSTSDNTVEPVKEVTLMLKGILAFKVTILAKEAASTNDFGSCLYHFNINIEPMAKLVNMLPCDVHLYISLNRLSLNEVNENINEDGQMPLNNKYTVSARLKPRESFGIVFSDQKLFMRLGVIGTQQRKWNPELQTSAESLEYMSPVFQVFLNSTGSVSIVKALRLVRGPIEDLMRCGSQDSPAWQSFINQYKTMSITIDISRHYIRLWWPFIFENMTSNSLIVNGRLLAPKARYFGNLYDASNCRIRALIATQKQTSNTKLGEYAMSQSIKLDATSTTDFRPPMKFTIAMNKKTTTQMIPVESSASNTQLFESLTNNPNVVMSRRYERNHKIVSADMDEINQYIAEEVQKTTEPEQAQCMYLCLGSTVRYADYPYEMCKIVSFTDMYTFVNKLPFAVCVRGATVNSQQQDMLTSDVTSDIVLLPGDSGCLHTTYTSAYVASMENGMCSGVFPLQYQRVPYLFQLEINSRHVTYSTVATRGVLIQTNVISGVFKGSKVPYSHNGYYFVLSLPKKPQYQILNLTKYTLAYTVPENIKSNEAQDVDNYKNHEQPLDKATLNKIGILPPVSITHYVTTVNDKAQESPQVALKVIQVDNSSWGLQQLDSGRDGYQTITFVDKGTTVNIYASIIIRANGTRIVVAVESKKAAIELNRIGSCAMSNGPKLQWSNIYFNFLTPRITVTLSTNKKVILALHLTNTSVGVTLAPSKKEQLVLDRDSNEAETYRSNTVEFDGIIQSIHIDHFLQGYIPVILKSSAKRSSTQESFLHLRVLLSNLMAIGLPVYDLIQIKMSPMSVNIETAVIEQLLGSVETMLKLRRPKSITINEEGTSNDDVVTPEPKWVEMEPTLPVYIRKLTIDPITLSLAIRTSSLRLTHHTMRIVDALPLDTPCVYVHFARVARSCLIVGWRELMHSLRNTYLRQLIRQSLPSAWLSNIFAVLHRLFNGLLLLVVQPIQSATRFKNVLEGFFIGMGSGIMLCLLYMVGGTAQTLGHVLNVCHKIVGGQRSKPQGVLDAIWLGLNALFLHVFFTPWKRLYIDFTEAQSSGDSVFKISVGVFINLTRCAVSPLIGVVNMLITVVEGFSNVLLGDFEQFTHVYESDQLGGPGNVNNPQQDRRSDTRDSTNVEMQTLQRRKTSLILNKRVHSR